LRSIGLWFRFQAASPSLSRFITQTSLPPALTPLPLPLPPLPPPLSPASLSVSPASHSLTRLTRARTLSLPHHTEASAALGSACASGAASPGGWQERLVSTLPVYLPPPSSSLTTPNLLSLPPSHAAHEHVCPGTQF
jgi:hypothetical protein